MNCKNDGFSLLGNPRQHVDNDGGSEAIESWSWFVENQDSRIGYHLNADAGSLSLASRNTLDKLASNLR